MRRLLTNSVIYGLAPYIPRIITLLLYPIITKYLTDVDFGVYGIVTAYTAGLSVFSTLGMQVVLTNSFFRSPCQYKWLWRQLYGFLQIWLIIFALIQSLILFFVLTDISLYNKVIIIILANLSSVVMGANSLIGTMYYQLAQKPIPIVIRNLVSAFLSLGVSYVCIVVYKLGYIGWFAGMCISSLFLNLSYYYTTRKTMQLDPIYKFKIKTIISTLKIAVPTIPHYYSYFLIENSSKILMERNRIDISVIGEFSLAQQFSNLIGSFVNAINTAMNPMAMSLLKKDSKKSVQLNLLFFLISSTIVCLYSIWCKDIFCLLINNNLLISSYKLSIPLVMAYSFRPLYVSASNIFFFYEQTFGLLKITFTSGLLALVGYSIFIPLYGVVGAVYVFYFSMCFMGISGYFSKVYITKAQVIFPWKICTIFSLMNLLIVNYVVECSILLRGFISLIYLILFVVLFFLFIKKESL